MKKIQIIFLISLIFSQLVNAEELTKMESIAEKKPVSADHLDDKATGLQLREAIDADYKRLVKARAITFQNQGQNLLYDTITKYIPLGTPLNKAEKILSSAGFSYQLITQQRNGVKDEVGYEAIIFDYDSSITSNTHIVVHINYGDPNNVLVSKLVTLIPTSGL